MSGEILLFFKGVGVLIKKFFVDLRNNKTKE
jgi:hypothetical protein